SDIDASGLSNLRNSDVPVGFKDVSELKALCERSSKPVILKGIMSVKGARKAMQAGAAGIIVSNHGGRVLDGAQSGIEVLEDIVAAVGKTMKVFVDGGFRSGNDVFKALALG
ncbi:MAG: alpha-hydroxy-acid oxidizing protein, partial [Merdibacter sp.]